MLEETVIKQIRSAQGASPAVLYMPHCDRWWKCMGESIQVALCSALQARGPSDLWDYSLTLCPYILAPVCPIPSGCGFLLLGSTLRSDSLPHDLDTTLVILHDP